LGQIYIGLFEGDEMKERIDKFMKAVREKYPSNGLAWENLYRELSELCKEDDRKELVKQWGEYHREIKLADWDDAFMELVINGAKVNEVSGATYARGAVMGWNDALKKQLQAYRVIDPQKLIK